MYVYICIYILIYLYLYIYAIVPNTIAPSPLLPWDELEALPGRRLGGEAPGLLGQTLLQLLPGQGRKRVAALGRLTKGSKE